MGTQNFLHFREKEEELMGLYHKDLVGPLEKLERDWEKPLIYCESIGS